MNLLTRLYPGDEFCIDALNVIVQVTVIALVAVIASRTIARRNAAFGHCILLLALLWIPITPFAASRMSRTGFLTVKLDYAVRPIEVTSIDKPDKFVGNVEARLALPPPSGEGSGPGIQSASGAASPTPAPPTDSFPLRAIVVLALFVWCAGSLALTIRLLHGLRGVAGILRRARPADDAVKIAMQDVCSSMSGRVCPRVVVSENVRGPVTIGVWRRAIVLPLDFVHDIPADQLRDVLVHECVHAVRHDYAMGILQRVIAAGLWFHPMVHLLNRELCRAREEVCDNAVLSAGNAAGYARTLLDLSERMRPQLTPRLMPGLFDRAWPLEQRVAGILNHRRVVMTRIGKAARASVGASVVALGLLMPAIGVSRGQSAPQDTAATSRPSDTPRASDSLAAFKSATDLISPEEEIARNMVFQGRNAVQRAQLNLDEAQLKLQIQDIELFRKEKLVENKAVPSTEVEQARLDRQLMQIQVKRAMINCDEAVAAAVVVREIGLEAWDGVKHDSDLYSVRGDAPTVKEFLQQHFKDALSSEWDVTLTRNSRGSGGRRVILKGVTNLNTSPQSGERLQAGDWVHLRRNIVRVQSNAGSGKVLWEGPVNGQLTVVDVLKLANVHYDEHDNRKVTLSGQRFGARDQGKNWSCATVVGFPGIWQDEPVEPSDTITLNGQ